ncbi:MAG: GTP 3',8-cyclase MoaA [Candidatus Omnitrophota bacterium]
MSFPNYLRVSVTNQCNLNCIYCRPKQDNNYRDISILSNQEIIRLIKVFVNLGVDSIRITGGEPLLRDNLIGLVKNISKTSGIKDLSLTTNGILLKDYASYLKEAGIRRINISLNSLDKEKFFKISGQDVLDEVLLGIDYAFKSGFNPVKINSVILKQINEEDIFDLVKLTSNLPIYVRFIEYSPTNYNMPDFHDLGILSEEILIRLKEKFGMIYFDESIPVNGPARYYKIKGSSGNIGFISGYSQDFCSQCNRLRLTCDGRLLLCLYSKDYLDLKNLIRSGINDENLGYLIKDFVSNKSQVRKPPVYDRRLEMSCVGG